MSVGVLSVSKFLSFYFFCARGGRNVFLPLHNFAFHCVFFEGFQEGCAC